MICSRCGYEIDDQSTYCPYCGQSVQKAAPDTRERRSQSADYEDAERSPQGTGYRTRPRPPRITLEDLPPELRPLHAWSYVGWGILFSLPIAGLVLVIVFSCVSGNINRKRFARSYLCWLLIFAVIITILAVLGVVTWNTLVNSAYWPFGR